VGPRSHFVREYQRLFTSPMKRLDRIPMSEFSKHVIVGRARTVKEDSDQKDLPERARYSVIDELIRIES
jgi:hypothetical protein